MADPVSFIASYSQGGSNPPKNDLASMIYETAQAIGADPIDLATVISYETGGTFDPMQPGPTTQWGQHRGLIQFGEPQAQQHGVDFSSRDAALRSQLGPDGAVASYFRSSGYKPGMGMMDLYSTVNAGGPGRYKASDANNGGAPGTVADKVNSQMAGHRRKAVALMGGEYTPTYSGSYGGQPETGQAPYAGVPYMPYPQNALAAMSQPSPEQMAQQERMNRLAMIPDTTKEIDPRSFMVFNNGNA